jgi:D-arabinose 1-dehydrogenase-like Zn-dependent alcohol dehydrogenase
MKEREFFISRWAAEMPLTLGVLQALPDAKLDYRPHEKCRTACSIVGHLLGHVEDLNDLATATGAIHHRVELPFKNIADALERMKKADAEVQSRLRGIDEST